MDGGIVFIVVMILATLVGYIRRQRHHPMKPEKIERMAEGYRPEREIVVVPIARELQRDRLQPLHGLERLRWHRTKGTITTAELQMVMWLVYPDWMKLMEANDKKRRGGI
jgi:hypothetical protein